VTTSADVTSARDSDARISATRLPPPPATTVIDVRYPPHRGAIGLRGSHAPLSWEHTTPPTAQTGDRYVFELAVPPGEVVELKLVRGEDDWAKGRNYAVHAGDHLYLEPYFDRAQCTLRPRESVAVDGDAVTFQVLLPPSYDEQEDKRYPVLYAQDGQALWSTSEDPYGIWHLDATLDQLYEIGAIAEIIVVAIDTSTRRVERLSPLADPVHGGGEGKAHLRALVDHVRARVNGAYRTRTGREDTALLGSSMGGLFSFYAAWTRPETFGKAACLSSSFWWAERHAVRMVQQSPTPEPRPVLYLDSGAARSALEPDANARDGFHHTRSMVRALLAHGYRHGVDLHRLTFAGAAHDAASWAARVAIPLQLLFPPADHRPEPDVLRESS
jgi:predicted alpha/beta superfamily hydrolase